MSSNPILQWVLPKALAFHAPWFLSIRQRILGETGINSGTISVVVPFFNTEAYLEAALESIRLQRYWDLEIILVDDGSTDGSTEIAAKFVQRDSRFQLLSTNRVGPGAARNVGIAAATGAFLAFVDGDDILPIGSLSRLAGSLSISGSDFAVGGFEHLEGEHRWRSPWVEREHGVGRQRVSLRDCVGITRNVFPWNKLFRMEFFRSYVREFPEGVLYEDQVPTANAYVSSTAFDILSETVYHWRRRESGESITQNRSSDSHLENRFAVMDELDEIYSAEAPKEAYRAWLTKSLFEDLVPFIEASPHASSSYRKALVDKSRELWSMLSEEERAASGSHPNTALLRAIIDDDYDQAWSLLAAPTD